MLALETLNTKYPSEDWLHIYTDGSLSDQIDGAGAGGTSRFFSFYKSVGHQTTNFDGEVEAIHSALQHTFPWLQKCKHIVILSDSKAAIQAIGTTSCPKMEKIKEIQHMINQIQNLGKNIVLHGYQLIVEFVEMKELIYWQKRAQKLNKKTTLNFHLNQ